MNIEHDGLSSAGSCCLSVTIQRLVLLLVLPASFGACQKNTLVTGPRGSADVGTDRSSYKPDRKGAEEAVKRGDAAHVKSDETTAIAEFTTAIRLDPTYANGYFGRGEVRRLTGEYQGAVDDDTQAIRLSPIWASPFLARGNAYENLARYKEAIADYTEDIQLKPSAQHLAQAYFWRGECYANTHDLGKAIADYSDAARLDPKFSGSFYKRGAAYKELGENEKAEVDFKRAKELGYGN